MIQAATCLNRFIQLRRAKVKLVEDGIISLEKSLKILQEMYFRSQNEILESCFELKDKWDIIQFEMYPNIVCTHCQGLTNEQIVHNHWKAIRATQRQAVIDVLQNEELENVYWDTVKQLLTGMI